MMVRKSCLLAVTLFTVAAALALAAAAQQSSKTNTKAATDDAGHTIVLPQYPVSLPPGPHQDTFANDCQICHSARYVTIQPPFPQATWEKEVKKMVDAYGAQISEADQHEIVEYLVATHGPSDKSTQGPSDKK